MLFKFETMSRIHLSVHFSTHPQVASLLFVQT